MSDNFSSLKRSLLVQIIVKALLLGIACGMLVCSSIALAQRLITENINLKLCILIGLAVFALVVGICMLINRPSEKKIARELDERLALKEKVQTMLAYKKKEGAIYDLQRGDTDKSLTGAKINIFSYTIVAIIAYFILAGVGMMIAALSIPEETEPPYVKPIVPFEITEIQIEAVEELIAYVEGSEMDEPYRKNTADALKSLLEELKLVTNVEERDASIEKAINAIYAETDNSSSAIEIINELWKTNTEATKKLAKALNYYDWPKIEQWDKFADKITDAREALISNEKDEQKKLDKAKDLFADTAQKITASLTSSKIDKEDEFYKVLLNLATANEVNEEFGTRVYGLQALSTLIDTVGYSDAQRELDNTFTVFNNEVYRVLSQHLINTSTGEYAITRICVLFSYPLPTFERPQLIESSTEDDGSGEGSGSSGAIGEGTEYGSDDLVYDPLTGEYVEYGVILDRYYALMFGKLEGADYTEEEKKAIEKYFDILYGGFDDENE